MNYFQKIIALGTLFATGAAHAQNPPNNFDNWHIGVGGGFNVSSLSFSQLDEDFYPDRHNNFSGVFSVFGNYEFGYQKQFAVGAQLAFLSRGGRISEIGRSYFEDYFSPNESDRLKDVSYRLKATYFDIRIPLMYQFGKHSWRFRPYAYIAPIIGFVTNGHTDARFDYADNAYQGVKYDLTKTNMASVYFAGAIGVGAKYNFFLADCPFYLAMDMNYQFGFNDTYGSAEKNGDAMTVTSFFPTRRKVVGKRKISGFEMQFSLGVPLSVFSKRNTAKTPSVETIVAKPAHEPEVVQVQLEEKPCYTLDEIMSLMSKGETVVGKTICSIDDINFDFGKSTIKPSSYPYLNKPAKMLVRTNATICVKGHTDNIGSEESNLLLSKQRAEAVMAYLEKEGVSKSKLSYEYYGMSRPLTSNDTEEGRLQNRRVEFEIRSY